MSNDAAPYLLYAKTCAGIYPADDFEGLLVKYYPRTQQLQFRGYFEKGLKRQGQHICFWESGVLQEVSHWKDGWAIGVIIRYHENGMRDLELHYGVEGGRSRKWIEIHYGYLTDEIYSIWEMDGFEIVREWKNAEAVRLWKTIDGDRIVDDAVRKLQLEDVTADDEEKSE